MLVGDTILGRLPTGAAPKPWTKSLFIGQPDSVVLGVHRISRHRGFSVSFSLNYLQCIVTDINVHECFLHDGHPPFSQQLIPIPGLLLPPGKSLTFQLNNFYCCIQNVNSSLHPCQIIRIVHRLGTWWGRMSVHADVWTHGASCCWILHSVINFR